MQRAGAVLILVTLTVAAALAATDDPSRRAGATYTGRASCIGCHETTKPELVATYQKGTHGQARPTTDATGMALFRCVTGLRPDGKFLEAGAGCEMCHGPGSLHRESSMPRHIMRFRDLTPARSAMVCGACHSVGKTADGLDYPAAYKPGDDLATTFAVDAKAKGAAARYNEFVRGNHGKSGRVSCVSCHEPHGTKLANQLKAEGNLVCEPCHASKVERPVRHQREAARKPCTACHMPDGNHAF